MSKSSVLVTKRIPSVAMARLEAVCEVDRHDGDRTLSHDELIVRVQGKQALVCLLTDTVDRAVLDAGRDLKIIANVAVGYDNIDVTAARERGIIVTNTPDVLTEASADLTWALILDVTRRISEGDRLIRRGGWKGWGLDFMLGSELGGKQLGIVGMGRIGRAVAAKAPLFGLRVACLSRTRQEGGGVQPMPLDRLLATSDIVSLHCPLTDETMHLINQAALARMKRTAYLINTARGAVVEEGALVWALKNRIIAGAALDVYEKEPDVHPELLALENVVLAPHLGSATTETRTAMANLAVRNTIAVLSGQAPLTPVP